MYIYAVSFVLFWKKSKWAKKHVGIITPLSYSDRSPCLFESQPYLKFDGTDGSLDDRHME